jgi:hypothetical protein
MSSTPSIRISQPQRYASPPSSSSFQPDLASPMPIPNAQDAVPPALPPPTHIADMTSGQDPGWQWGNDPASTDFGRSAPVKPGSSLLGGGLKSPPHAKELDHIQNGSMDDGRRGSSLATITASTRDHEMLDAQQSQSDEEGASRSRSGSTYRYVNSFVGGIFANLDRSMDERQPANYIAIHCCRNRRVSLFS